MHRGAAWAGRAGACILVLGGLAAACKGSYTPPAASAEASILQLRGVENVVPRSSPEWNSTELTCPGGDAAGCLAARRDEPVVLLGAGPMDKYLLGPVVVDGGDVAEASARRHEQLGWLVVVKLTPGGSEALATATRAAAGEASPRLAIVVGARVVSAPTAQQEVTSGMVVVNGLTETAARGLASDLNGSG